MEAFKEKAVGIGLVAGAVLVVIGIILMAMFVGGGVMHGTYTREAHTNRITDPGDLNLFPLAFFVFVLGLLSLGASIGYALWQHRQRNEGVRASFDTVRVIARYGYSKDWNMITADWELEQAENPRYYVRVDLGQGDVREFECAPATYYNCGEGMFGRIEVQGKWLGKFEPFIGMPVVDQTAGR